MKMSRKFFVVAYIVVILTVGAGGFALADYASASLIENRVNNALSSNLYSAKLFLTMSRQSINSEPNLFKMNRQISGITESDGFTLNICRLNKLTGYGTSEQHLGKSLKNSQQGYAFIDFDGKKTLQVICRADYMDKKYFVETLSDFSEIFARRDALNNYYRITMIIAAVLSGGVLLCFSAYITRPLKRLSETSNQIATGDYGKRVPIDRRTLRSSEIATLSRDFNAMAQAVEGNIARLREEIEKKDAFVGNFTHELKTPMTAIIGYADMLRSYNLSDGEKLEIADTIYSEAKRLEKLSLKLLNILMLNNSELVLQPTSVTVMFDNLKKSLRFLSEKYGIRIKAQGDSAFVLCDSVLISSLLYNLTDNACKVSNSGELVCVFGKREGENYIISVSDNGRGISEENLSKITEPFFTVDKSRSRQEGGVGLGLALCNKIAKLHNTELNFKSEPGKGTVVTIMLKVRDGEKYG